MKLAPNPKLVNRQDGNLDIYVYIININCFNTIEAVLNWNPIQFGLMFKTNNIIEVMSGRQCQIGIIS